MRASLFKFARTLWSCTYHVPVENRDRFQDELGTNLAQFLNIGTFHAL